MKDEIVTDNVQFMEKTQTDRLPQTEKGIVVNYRYTLLNIELLHIRHAMIDAIDLCNETVSLHKDNPDSESLVVYMNDKKANLEVALTKLNYD